MAQRRAAFSGNTSLKLPHFLVRLINILLLFTVSVVWILSVVGHFTFTYSVSFEVSKHTPVEWTVNSTIR